MAKPLCGEVFWFVSVNPQGPASGVCSKSQVQIYSRTHNSDKDIGSNFNISTIPEAGIAVMKQRSCKVLLPVPPALVGLSIF